MTVAPEEMVLHHHASWRDWFDSDFALGLAALVGVVLVFSGFGVEGPGGIVLSVTGVLLVLPVVVVQVTMVVVLAFSVVRGVVLLMTRTGRSRMRRGASKGLRSIRHAGETWRVARSTITAVSLVEHGRRPRLCVTTQDDEVILSTTRRQRGRLEALAQALQTR